MRFGRFLDVLADLGDDAGAPSDVGHEVAVPAATLARGARDWQDRGALHDVNVQPVGALLDGSRAFRAEVGQVGRQQRGRDNRLGSHEYQFL